MNRWTRLVDIEVDLMIRKDHKSALMVMTDRTTLQTRLKKLAGKQATQVKKVMIQTLKKVPYPIKTLTFDNEMAFSQHLLAGKALGAETFHTRPYTSQDKGTVENRLGVIRIFFSVKINTLPTLSQKT
jgi:transposase, IS30 family